MYFCTSFSTAEAAQIQPPLRIFDPAARARAAAATLSSAFGTPRPCRVSQSLTKQLRR